jgi:hypothetical protein
MTHYVNSYLRGSHPISKVTKPSPFKIKWLALRAIKNSKIALTIPRRVVPEVYFHAAIQQLFDSFNAPVGWPSSNSPYSDRRPR